MSGSTRAAVATALLLASSLAWTSLRAPAPPPLETAAPSDAARDAIARVRARAAAPGPRFDRPAAAAEHYALKRRPRARGADPAALRRAALREMAEMPVWSTRSGRFLEIAERPRRATWLGAAAGLDTWEPLGPGNIGGRTRAMVIHPKKRRILYAGGVSGGIWKSTNGGQRWRPVGDELANIAVNALAIDPSNPKVIYAGTGEGYFREVVRGTGLPLRGAGIFWSENRGKSWRQMPSTTGSDFHWVNDLVVSRVDSRRLYAATREGVFRSDDRGTSWTRVLAPRANGGCLDLAELPGGPGDDLLASCGTLGPAAVYRKLGAEGGGPWERVLAEEGMGRTSLAVAPSDPSVVYALAASNVPGPDGHYEQALHAVFRSDAGGAAGSWEARVRNTDERKLNTVLLHNPVIAFLEECGFDSPNEFFAMGWYVNVIVVDPTDPDRVWAAGVDLLRSDDGGRNWNVATYWWNTATPNFVHADHHGLVFDPKRPNILYSLNDGGVWRTLNAGAPVAREELDVCVPGSSQVQWRHLNSNYGATQFYHGTPLPGGEGYMAGAQDNGTVMGFDRLGPNSWGRAVGGDGGYSAVNPDNPDELYATIQNGVVFKTTGLGWDEATEGITDLDVNETGNFRAVGPAFLFISPLVLDADAPQTLWMGGRRMWRTTDGAGRWEAASAVFPGGAKASAVAIDPADSSHVLAGSHTGEIFATREGMVSGPETAWQGVRPRPGFVSSVAFDPGDPRTVYATYGGFGGKHVWRSRNGGATWRAIDGKRRNRLPDLPVHSIAVDPRDGRRLYIGTDLGVFVSLDGGKRWAVENTGFPAAVTEWLAIEEKGGVPHLFAFTHGRGAWRVPLE